MHAMRGWPKGPVLVLLLVAAWTAPAPADDARSAGGGHEAARRAVAAAEGGPAEALLSALDDLVRALAEKGDLAALERTLSRSLSLRDRHLGAEAPETVQTLIDRTTVLRLLGEDGLAALGPLAGRLLSLEPDRFGRRSGEVALTHYHHAALSRPPDAILHMQRAVELLAMPDVDGPLDDARAYLALLLADAGRHEAAAQVLAEVPADHPSYVGRAVAIVFAYRQRGDVATAAAWLRRLEPLPEAQIGAHAPTLADLATLVGDDLLAVGEHAAAERAFDQALALRSSYLPPTAGEIGETLSKLGLVSLLRGRPSEAEERFRRALAVLDDTPGAEAALSLTLEALAGILSGRGEYRAAEGFLERALGLATAGGRVDPRLEGDLGRAKLELGELEAALVHLARALAAWPSPTTPPGEYDRALALLLNDLARAEERRGRMGEAERHLRRALGLVRDSGGPEAHPADAARLEGSLARTLWKQGRLDEAEEAALSALSLDAGGRVEPEELPALLRGLAGETEGGARGSALEQIKGVELLALVAQSRGDLVHSRELLAGVVAARGLLLPQGHPDLVTAETNLGQVFLELGEPAEAVRRQRRALASLGDGDRVLAASVRINLAAALRATGDAGAIGEATALAEEAVGLLEGMMGAGEPAAVEALAEVGVLYADLGDLEEAELLLGRVVRQQEARGAGEEALARSLNNLAALRIAQGRPGEAETLLRRALSLGEPGRPDRGGDRAGRLGNLAMALGLQGRHGEARPLHERALAALRERLGDEHPDVAVEMAALAATEARLGRLGRAAELVDRSLATLERRTGPDSVQTARARALRGIVRLMAASGRPVPSGELDAALADLRRATEASSRPDVRPMPDAADHLPFHAHAAALAAARATGAEREALLSEALQVAQGVKRLAAAGSVAAAGVRRAVTDRDLSAMIRRHQDLLAAVAGVRAALSATYADAAQGWEEAGERRSLRARLTELEREADRLTETIEARFPRYAAASSPPALALHEVRRLLGEDEALLLFASSDLSRALPGATGSLAIAVTDEAVRVEAIPVEGALLQKIAALRCTAAVTDPLCDRPSTPEAITRGAFDMAAAPAPVGLASGSAAFDGTLAAAVYAELIGPLEALIRDKTHWIVVPDATMVGLPFNLLARAAPGSAGPDWLIRHHAVSVVPSLAGLQALRDEAPPRERVGEAFLGVGDPVIGIRSLGGGPLGCRGDARTGAVAAPTRGQIEAVRSGAADGPADVEAIRSLPALPETRCEIEELGRRLTPRQGDRASLLLGEEATETRLKAMSAAGELARQRVIAFATHGLVGGELGRHESALVLTPPVRASAEDDGLLTAAEIARLRLNAEWVILSACNTAAGGDAGEEGLSGLASAFFYAGGRSLLVSAWPVYSDAAARLTTATLAARAADPDIGRAEALRRAMLTVLEDPGSSERERHPAYWAPFLLVGDGGAGTAPVGEGRRATGAGRRSAGCDPAAPGTCMLKEREDLR